MEDRRCGIYEGTVEPEGTVWWCFCLSLIPFTLFLLWELISETRVRLRDVKGRKLLALTI